MKGCASCDHAEDQHGLAGCLIRECHCSKFEPGEGIPMPANAGAGADADPGWLA
jgi:hypothetical protein